MKLIIVGCRINWVYHSSLCFEIANIDGINTVDFENFGQKIKINESWIMNNTYEYVNRKDSSGRTFSS